MKVLLNGATGGTNFGDFLFARMFHDAVSAQVGEENVFWYESRYCLSDFYKRHLKCRSRKHKLRDIDALICISGGYFCGGDVTLRQYLIRYLRYFHLCMRCILRKIPIAIVGVDIARPNSRIMDRIQRFILQRAELVVVRNEESLEQAKRYGVKNPLCTADTAHSISPDLYEHCAMQEEIAQITGKKLFFHVQPSQKEEARRLLPVVDRFVKNHPEYSVVVGADQYWSGDTSVEELAKEFSCSKVVVNRFDDPLALCKVLDAMDLIITPKLHVGIVGATLEKTVVSFSVHTEKIGRFYHQLGEDERSLPMKDFSEEKALSLLEKYKDVPIRVNPEILRASRKNLEYLSEFINKQLEG